MSKTSTAPDRRAPCLYRERANRAVTDPQAIPPGDEYLCDLDRPEWPRCGLCPCHIPATEAED